MSLVKEALEEIAKPRPQSMAGHTKSTESTESTKSTPENPFTAQLERFQKRLLRVTGAATAATRSSNRPLNYSPPTGKTTTASLAKEAATDQQRLATRHDYYMRNREKLKRQKKEWRLSHAAQIKKYQKRRRRMIRAGAVIPRRRAAAGAGSVQFLGTKTRLDLATPGHQTDVFHQRSW